MDSVCFGLSEPHDEGFRSGLAMRGDLVVGVHQSQNQKDLWYRIGGVEIGIVRWITGHQYDTGITPAVAFAGNATIVEVHKSENNDRLYYHVGSIAGTTPQDISITWSKSDDYDNGVQPRVAANASGLVVEVHKSEKEDVLWYHVGHVDGTRVKWEDSHKYTTGTHPAIALFDDGTVVEIHESENTEFLWYMTGKVTGNTIKWEKSVKHVEGRAPVIACDSPTGQVIEIHENAGELVSMLGVIAGTSVTWGDSHHFDSGTEPAVAYSGSTAVQTHTNEALAICSSLSVVIDRKEWMRARQEVLDQRKLYELVLPATHDSGTYDLGSEHVPDRCRTMSFDVPKELEEPYARAQSRDLAGQLSRGIRYFDLRVIPKDGDFRVFHDLIANTNSKVSSMLDQLAEFLGSVTRELVIVKFSHFCEFNDDHHAKLIGMIVDKIGPYLYAQGTMTAEEVMKLYFGDVTKDGPRVLIHYHDKKDGESYIKDHPANGFFGNLPTFDEFSGVDTYQPMHDDQLDKLKNHQANPDKFFLLSWTLTPTGLDSMLMYPSLHGMSHEPNRKLGAFCNKWAPVYKMSFLYVDFFEDARAVDIAIQMNG